MTDSMTTDGWASRRGTSFQMLETDAYRGAPFLTVWMPSCSCPVNTTQLQASRLAPGRGPASPRWLSDVASVRSGDYQLSSSGWTPRLRTLIGPSTRTWHASRASPFRKRLRGKLSSHRSSTSEKAESFSAPSTTSIQQIVQVPCPSQVVGHRYPSRRAASNTVSPASTMKPTSDGSTATRWAEDARCASDPEPVVGEVNARDLRLIPRRARSRPAPIAQV